MNKVLNIMSKKVLIIILTIGVLLLFVGISIVDTNSSSSSPIAHWPMDDTAGSSVIKEIISQNNASPSLSPLGSSQAPQPTQGILNGLSTLSNFLEQD
jgi:hypothetical protein